MTIDPSVSINAPEILNDHVLTWPESPRWRDGGLWLSDVYGFRVVRISSAGTIDREIPIPGRPAGLGFATDGSLLVAGGVDRKLWAISSAGAVTDICDLGPLTSGLLNDMVVDQEDRAYIGDTGFNLVAGETPRPGRILLVRPGENPIIVAEYVQFPNGMAISMDRSTLFVSETLGRRILAFPISADGGLGAPSVHAGLESAPDGLCLDAEGHLWVPLLYAGEFQRISASGAIIDRITFPGWMAVACVFGGQQRERLFLTVGRIADGGVGGTGREGRVLNLVPPVSGAGLP